MCGILAVTLGVYRIMVSMLLLAMLSIVCMPYLVGANGWLLIARWPALVVTLPSGYISWLLGAQVGALRTRLTYRLPVRLLSICAVFSVVLLVVIVILSIRLWARWWPRISISGLRL